jgi:hypothetical protein
MGYSTFDLNSGIGSDGKSVRAIKTQAGHGFSAGTVVRYELDADGEDGAFKLARADSVVNAEAVGVVESVSGSQFTVVYQGEINTGNFITATPSNPGLTGSDVWFMDAGVSGGLTATAPAAAGSVVKPIITLVSGSNDDIGLVTNYVGTVVGGENTVSLDSVHPVGHIVPWGGETYNIPNGWQLCDGATVDVVGYPDYYNRVGTKFGYWAQADIEFGSIPGGDNGAIAGATAVQSISSTSVNALVISYTASSASTGSVILDPDYLVGGFSAGGETSGEIAPHGLVFNTTPQLTFNNAGGNTAVNVDAVTVIAAKTPDLRARHIITATDGFGTFEGYTAGQIGGQEDVDTVRIENDEGTDFYAYKAAGPASDGNLRSPYMALHHIIRIDSLSKSAIIGDVSVNDDGITDHETEGAIDGDILTYGPVSGVGAYRNLKIFSGYPSTDENGDVSAFENAFRIKTSGTYGPSLNIGAVTPNSESDQIYCYGSGYSNSITIHREGGGRLSLISGSSRSILRTQGDNKYCDIETDNGGSKVATAWAAAGAPSGMASGFTVYNKFHTKAGISCDAEIVASGNISSKGQIYSTQPVGSSNTPDFDWDNGNVQVIEIDGNVTVGTNAKQVLGGMYTIVLRNTASSTKNVSFDDANMVFANNIKPSRISGYGNLVISMVCTVANGELLCTYADFA